MELVVNSAIQRLEKEMEQIEEYFRQKKHLYVQHLWAREQLVKRIRFRWHYFFTNKGDS